MEIETTVNTKHEHSKIIRNTKLMEHNFISRNLDLNRNELDFCKNSLNEKINFISSKTQINLMNRLLAEVTKSVIENDTYDETDTNIKRAKRIYSRKKEIIKIITTLFDNGGFMVKYFKYVTKSGSVTSKDITGKHIRNFIMKLRSAYNGAQIMDVEGDRYIKPDDKFIASMVKLDIYSGDDLIRHDFQYV